MNDGKRRRRNIDLMDDATNMAEQIRDHLGEDPKLFPQDLREIIKDRLLAKHWPQTITVVEGSITFDVKQDGWGDVI